MLRKLQKINGIIHDGLTIKSNWFTIRFKNAATQIPQVEQFLPINL